MVEKLIRIETSNDEYVQIYLSLFYDSLKLTDKEKKVLEMIIRSYIGLKDKVQEPYLTELILSTDRRKNIRESINISGAYLNNIIRSLREKGVFKDTEEIKIDERLVPTQRVTFEFEIVESIKKEVKPKEKKNEQAKST